MTPLVGHSGRLSWAAWADGQRAWLWKQAFPPKSWLQLGLSFLSPGPSAHHVLCHHFTINWPHCSPIFYSSLILSAYLQTRLIHGSALLPPQCFISTVLFPAHSGPLLTTAHSMSTRPGWQKRAQSFLINAASEHSTGTPGVAFPVLGMSHPQPLDGLCVWEIHTCISDVLQVQHKARMVKGFITYTTSLM